MNDQAGLWNWSIIIAAWQAKSQRPLAISGSVSLSVVYNLLLYRPLHNYNYNLFLKRLLMWNSLQKIIVIYTDFSGLVLGLIGESKHIKRYSKVSEFVKKDCNRAVIQGDCLDILGPNHFAQILLYLCISICVESKNVSGNSLLKYAPKLPKIRSLVLKSNIRS